MKTALTAFNTIRYNAENSKLGEIKQDQLHKAVELRVKELRQQWDDGTIDTSEWYETQIGIDYAACEVLSAGNDAIEKANCKLLEILTK